WFASERTKLALGLMISLEMPACSSALLSRSNRVRDRPVPTRITLRGVMRPEFIPVFTGDAVQVVNHLASAHGQLAAEFLIAAHARSADIHKTEVSIQHLEHGDIGRRAYR